MAASGPASKEEILSACSKGDTALLKQVFHAHGIKQGSAPILWAPDATGSGWPATETLITTAILQSQPATVGFLLNYFTGYPTEWSETRRQSQKPISLTSSIINAVLDHPNVEILHMLWDYDHSLVNFEFDDHTTFLSQACRRDPDTIGPVIQFLVSHGADMRAGWRLDWDLLPAIGGGQHLDVIEVMVAHGARMDYSAILAAVRAGRADVLQLCLDKGGMVRGGEGRLPDKDVEQLRDEARDAKSVSLVESVEALISASHPGDRSGGGGG